MAHTPHVSPVTKPWMSPPLTGHRDDCSGAQRASWHPVLSLLSQALSHPSLPLQTSPNARIHHHGDWVDVRGKTQILVLNGEFDDLLECETSSSCSVSLQANEYSLPSLNAGLEDVKPSLSTSASSDLASSVSQSYSVVTGTIWSMQRWLLKTQLHQSKTSAPRWSNSFNEGKTDIFLKKKNKILLFFPTNQLF